MKYGLYTRVALAVDLPPASDHPGILLLRGDIATIVEHHDGTAKYEPGYELEVFNALGDTVAVVSVRESQIEPLTADELLHVRTAQVR